MQSYSTHSRPVTVPCSHSHAASRVPSVCPPHIEQCSALKFICFSSGEQTFSNCLYQSCPCWNPKRLPDWPSSATPKDRGQWLSSQSCCFRTEALLLFGVASNFASWPDSYILFNRLKTLSDDTKSATHSQWIVLLWEHGGHHGIPFCTNSELPVRKL